MTARPPPTVSAPRGATPAAAGRRDARPAPGLRRQPRSSAASTSTSPPATTACVIGPSGSGKSTLLRVRQPAARSRRAATCCSPAERADATTPTSCASGSAWSSSTSTSSRTTPRCDNVTLALRKRQGHAQGRGRGARAASSSTEVGLADKADVAPRRPLRRPAAARRDRPGAGDGARGDAVRRGHPRARPRARQGRAGHDGRPRAERA